MFLAGVCILIFFALETSTLVVFLDYQEIASKNPERFFEDEIVKERCFCISSETPMHANICVVIYVSLLVNFFFGKCEILSG